MLKRFLHLFTISYKLVIFFLFKPKSIRIFIHNILRYVRSYGVIGFLKIYLGKVKGLVYGSALFATQYGEWLKKYEPSNRTELTVIDNFIKTQKKLPNFSIIISTYGNLNTYIKTSLDSVLNQSYPHWDVCIVDNNSSSKETREILEDFATKDKRFRIIYLQESISISKALNLGIENSKHEFITILGKEDVYDRDALYEFAKIISEKDDADIIYSDEDKINQNGVRFEPYFKPDWSPELLTSTMFIGNQTVYRKNSVKQVGMFRSEIDGMHDYDLVLRVSEVAKGIYHIPKILYHSRKISNSTDTNNTKKIGQKILEETLTRRGLSGKVLTTSYSDKWNVKIDVRGLPKVSIIIPTAAKSGYVRGKKIHFLMNCVESIIKKSTYTNYEIVVLHNGDLLPEIESQISKMKEVLLVHYDKKEFNLSEKMNLGVESSSGEYVIIFNDDIEIKSHDWIESLLGLAQLKGVGAVGAKLIFENNTIQHLGVVWTLGGPGHVAYGSIETEEGHQCINVLTHNLLMVTGACMMVRKTIFMELNGWDLNFPLNYNDVDFCLRLVEAGYRNILCPDSVLYHYESASKDGTSTLELLMLIAKWGNVNDPYYNPNFFRINPFYTLNWGTAQYLKYNYEFWLLRKLGDRKLSYPLKESSLFFSIITPMYNTNKKFLSELAKAILNQTYKNFEWVIVDNGSTDKDTLNLLNHLSLHKNVKLIDAGSNLGIIKGTQLGFQNSKGDYVLPVDHDDLITYDALQVISNVIANNNYPPILYSDEDKTNPESKFSAPFFKPDWDPLMFFNNCYIAHLCAIDRKIGIELDIYSDINAEGCHDWDTLYRFIRKEIAPMHIPEILYSWRIHPQSTASGVVGVKPYTTTSQTYVLNKQLDFLEKSDDYELIENKLNLNTGMWSLKRKTNFSTRMAIALEYNGNNVNNLTSQIKDLDKILGDNLCDLFININGFSFSLLESLSRIYSKGKIYLDDFFENSSFFSSYDIVFFFSDKLNLADSKCISEALSMLFFLDDCVLVSGKLKLDNCFLFADSYFDDKGDIINPGFGKPITSGGYYAHHIVQKTVDLVCPDYWAMKTSFLNEIYKEENLKVERDELGFALSIIAKNRNKRVVYSPYIELKIDSIKKEDNRYSALMKNNTNYIITNFKNKYFRIPDNLEL